MPNNPALRVRCLRQALWTAKRATTPERFAGFTWQTDGR